MHIFEQEIKDGLSDILLPAKASFAFDSAIAPVTDTSILEKLLKSTASAKECEELYPIKTVLVSTGWNINEDVFLQDETYLARNTPEDKPINYEHNELEIIGHMTSNSCIDDKGIALADNLDLASLPESFNIITDGVLYLHWQTEAKKKLLASIIETIQENKGRVSMECFFTGFDYAVIKNDKQYILARNQSTAFLTKFLKAYGGSGVYDGCRVGRALRNISFSGKGIVSNPANPKSIIITDTVPFKGVASVVDEVLGNSKQENSLMSVELETKLAELTKTIASLQAKNDELTKTLAENENKAVKAEIEASKAAVAEKETALKAANEKTAASELLVSEYKTKLEASETALKDANDKIAKAAAEQVKSGRIAALKAAGLDDAQATAKYEKFAALPDDMFGEVVALVKPVAAASAPTTPETPVAPKAGDVIDGADKGKDAALASTTAGNEPSAAEKLQTDLAAFADKRLGNKNKTVITKK
jgi:hypothetical protein